MDTLVRLVMAAMAPLHMLGVKIVAVLPAFAAALLLLFVGGLLSHWLRSLTEHVLDMLKIDDYSRRLGFSKLLARLGVGSHLPRFIGLVVHATVLTAFVLGAVNVMGFPAISDYLYRLLEFVPTLISAIVILAAGLFLGDLAGRIVHNAADANSIRGADSLMKVTHGIVVIFTGIIALELLGIDVRGLVYEHINVLVTAIMFGGALAFGVAFGMAGKETAERWIRDLTPKNKPVPGIAREAKLRVVK